MLEEEGPAAFAKAVRERRGLLLMDTTWRDAHQSRSRRACARSDILAVRPATAHALSECYSLENWGGATFDVCLRFLRECPWERLQMMREAVPNVPFQMLLRGANAVGYTNYPDNVVNKFVRRRRRRTAWTSSASSTRSTTSTTSSSASTRSARRAASSRRRSRTRATSPTPARASSRSTTTSTSRAQLVAADIHVLCIKDMAGLLKPAAATQLISALRQEFPSLPMHVHTHDTAGTGVASMLAARTRAPTPSTRRSTRCRA